MSSVGAVEARLVEILTPLLPAVGPFSACQVVTGPVSVTTVRGRVLVVGDADATQIALNVTSMDLSSGSKAFPLIIRASVSVAGTDLSVAQDRAEADFAIAVAAIQADPSLGFENLSASLVGGALLEKSAVAQGRMAAFVFPVQIFTTL